MMKTPRPTLAKNNKENTMEIRVYKGRSTIYRDALSLLQFLTAENLAMMVPASLESRKELLFKRKPRGKLGSVGGPSKTPKKPKGTGPHPIEFNVVELKIELIRAYNERDTAQVYSLYFQIAALINW